MHNMNPQAIRLTGQSPSAQIPWLQPPLSKGCTHSNDGRVLSRPSLPKKLKHKHKHNGIVCLSPNNTKAIVKYEKSNNMTIMTTNDYIVSKTISIKAVVTVLPKVGEYFKINLGLEILDRVLDYVQDFFICKVLHLELVSAQLDPKTGLEKEAIKGIALRTRRLSEDNVIKYETNFEVPIDFGEIGAVIVENEHHNEMYLKDMVLDGFPNGPINIICRSWVHSKFQNAAKRIFFTSKSYLPSETPSGLTRLRKAELANLQGGGDRGERKPYERIYDYDVYNDLGDPDKSLDFKRPIFGGKDNPYPRRCRTGRPRCNSDPKLEKRVNKRFYVPRDECFSETRQLTFSAKTLCSMLQYGVSPPLEFVVDNTIDSLFCIGIDQPNEPSTGNNQEPFFKKVLSRLVKALTHTGADVLRFGTPQTADRDTFFWFRDEEFSRQTLAGANPGSIRLITELPLMSKLDPEIYGPQESAITEDVIKQEIGGIMTVDEAIKQKKLFILDYHDPLVPFVNKVRDEIKGSTLYGSRTVFFLNPDNTLRLLAIELTRPPTNGKPQWKQVFRPSCWHSTDVWLWSLAKAHVLAHDSGYHQLVSHWLKSHCVTEPYIIATNRQLSVVHPIYRLLHPYFKCTMEINALSREGLISTDSIIERTFSLGKYSMEFSSVAYDLEWRFDLQSLPADLINRGMAVEDPIGPHGLKLTIEDYPYANDGLILWDSIKQWVTDYVNHYYPYPSLVQSDQELQAWWTEIRTIGHADKKDEPWWPVLKTPKDLIEIITTITWVTSGYHAAVNFGQYANAGSFPNRPTIARTNMPTEDPSDEDWKMFIQNPKATLLKCLQSQLQATTVVAMLDLLSNHFPDEEYIGEKMEQSWAEDPVIEAAFQRFNGRMKELERIIDERNKNKNLKNRNGAGIIPYELFKPFSQPGATGKGVPYSISI